MRGMMEAAGRPLSITILQQNRDPEGWRDFMKMIDEAVADGLDMRAQVAPRPIGTLFGLDLGRHGLVYHPSYKKIAEKTVEERVKIMRDPEFRRQLLSEPGTPYRTASPQSQELPVAVSIRRSSRLRASSRDLDSSSGQSHREISRRGHIRFAP